MRVLLDTSALVAMMDADDAAHAGLHPRPALRRAGIRVPAREVTDDRCLPCAQRRSSWGNVLIGVPVASESTIPPTDSTGSAILRRRR